MNDPGPNNADSIQAPFIFVGHGDPWPEEWLREHPGAVRIPATFVPRSLDPAEEADRLWGPSRTPGSFAPAQRPGPWLVDSNGRAWPRTVFGEPQRPLSEFPPGQRAPGEAIPPEYRLNHFDVTKYDPIAAWRSLQPAIADPARAAGIVPPGEATIARIVQVADRKAIGPNDYVPYNELPLVSRQILRERTLMPGGEVAVTIPPVYIAEPTQNGRGLVFRAPGTIGNANTIRMMMPDDRNPTMYLRYYNAMGQPISPFTGRTGPDSETHFPFGGAIIDPGIP